MYELDVKHKDWKTIYPVYLNSKRTIKDGRRIPLERGIENPTANEIFDAMCAQGYILEDSVIKQEKVKYQILFEIYYKLKN